MELGLPVFVAGFTMVVRQHVVVRPAGVGCSSVGRMGGLLASVILFSGCLQPVVEFRKGRHEWGQRQIWLMALKRWWFRPDVWWVFGGSDVDDLYGCFGVGSSVKS